MSSQSILSAITKTASADFKAYLAKGGTKAKTATIPASKKSLAAKIKESKSKKAKLAAPGLLARCREVVSGDWRAAMLLYRIAYLWRVINPKLDRDGKEWLAMTRDDWATSAGLSSAEMNKYAIPRLKKYGFGIVEIRAMGNGADKKLWVNLDFHAFAEAVGIAGYELKVAAANGLSLYDGPKTPKSPKPKKFPNNKDAGSGTIINDQT